MPGEEQREERELLGATGAGNAPQLLDPLFGQRRQTWITPAEPLVERYSTAVGNEVCWPNIQRPGNPEDHEERRVSLTSFDAPDVCPMDADASR